MSEGPCLGCIHPVGKEMAAENHFGNRKQESKKAIKKEKETKHTLAQEKKKKGNGQEKKKENTLSTKKATKKKKSFFLDRFLGREGVFFLYFLLSCSFYKFSPQVKALDLPVKLKTYRRRAHLIHVHCIQKRRHESGRSLLLFAKIIQQNHFLFVTLIMNRAAIFKSRKTIQLTFIREQIRICLCIHSSRHALSILFICFKSFVYQSFFMYLF